jgi:hypothetical protein
MEHANASQALLSSKISASAALTTKPTTPSLTNADAVLDIPFSPIPLAVFWSSAEKMRSTQTPNKHVCANLAITPSMELAEGVETMKSTMDKLNLAHVLLTPFVASTSTIMSAAASANMNTLESEANV